MQSQPFQQKATENFSEYADFGIAGYYPCWQNLPPVTAKTLIETVALCAGKMVEYKDNSIDFIDFEKKKMSIVVEKANLDNSLLHS